MFSRTILLVLLPHSTSDLAAIFAWITRVSWHQKGRTILDFNEARKYGQQWYQLDNMQIICTLTPDR